MVFETPGFGQVSSMTSTITRFKRHWTFIGSSCAQTVNWISLLKGKSKKSKVIPQTTQDLCHGPPRRIQTVLEVTEVNDSLLLNMIWIYWDVFLFWYIFLPSLPNSESNCEYSSMSVYYIEMVVFFLHLVHCNKVTPKLTLTNVMHINWSIREKNNTNRNRQIIPSSLFIVVFHNNKACSSRAHINNNGTVDCVVKTGQTRINIWLVL